MNKSNIAHRFQQPAENLLMKIAILAKEKEDIIDLSIGDPDLVTNSAIIEAAYADVKQGATNYTAPAGSKDFLQAVIDFYQKKYELTFQQEQVRATVGALHAMYLVMQVLLDPGDEVIIHEPYFSPYREQVVLSGGTPITVPTYEKNGFQLDVEDLKKAITKRTKAIIINSPNNPTGAVFSEETLKQIAKVAIENELFIISDEIYEDFAFTEKFVPMARLAPENTITISGVSKGFAMTGWRLGYLIAPAYINQIAGMINESITYSAPTASQRAGIYALMHYEELVPPTVAVFKERLEYIEQRVAEISYLSLQPVAGSMYAFINISKSGLDSVAFVEKVLEQSGVLFVPGKAFGATGDDYIRLAATQPLELLAEAFDRLESLTF
ncbi:pyridoxal phosphate-dependent aminotransferase [Enterococcus dongliensis]|uniref:Aminotransferase n=1 Tax=Enterococcus dongliensis TaxID=2559925 RepID=A0AAW8TLY5_9ENTE|nr:pyridoxal phosphate-dependent aminotransferase [Enterococcus dongliensis]MDT2597144.1 pyridoxal phosphate-dependent aminotransferase [Enterococcus dongliensis]MDT2613895.1 pyridoxal phosphate-dependent aminotransferase [Enterococcus dongliensis]MDT2638097.1 pyridoxal phosphate-dependent aminotransferase [Enterococcus dongliensis]MDT2642949.1 pyridoxal phosphate-dependent aminotransferase [Enterococcus dongliensis]MDT2648257.1 pyridoxal phosphate-dependent aminotransferase [Enterococcus dong